MSHTPAGVDRLLIRPASGRQAGAGASCPDRSLARHPNIQGQRCLESQTGSIDATMATAPDGTDQILTAVSDTYTSVPGGREVHVVLRRA